MVLFGHTHSGDTMYQTGNNGNLFISTARTGFSNPREVYDKYKSGYTIVDIKDLDVLCKYRKYINARNSFDADVDLAEGGEFKAKLLPKGGREEYHKLMNLTSELGKSKIDDINESLVVYGTDSVAPRSVSEIFVLPRLTDTPANYESFEQNKQLNIKDLFSFPENLLLFGDKESGKSTLLNKLFVEATEYFSFYQKVPAKIDFLDIKNKNIRSLIKSFINNISNSELDKLLADGKLLILVDNVVVGEEGSVISYKIQEFITKWPKIKFIAATSVHSSYFIENETNCLSGFKNIYIGSVGAKEFKSLATKWFCGQTQEWIKEHLEKLIKVFEKLKISRTFFSVSLFLWIIEKNLGYKPTNNYELLLMFMKYILEGFNLTNTRAGAYNFNKKVELLTELALEMYSAGDKENSYALKVSDVISVLQKNFDENQLRLKALDKVEEFVSKGILRYDNTNGALQFRFESFFQFFLAKNIGSNKDFSDVVVSDNSFLLFVEEIDFYTGYKRNDKLMLVRAVQELNKQFSELDTAYDEKNIDAYFPTTSFLLKHVSATKLVNRTKRMKLDNEEVEEIMGRQMDLLPVNDSIRVKESLPDQYVFSSALELTARVLKNSENIKDPAFINEVLDLIISKSAKMSVYMQSLLISQITNDPEFEKHDLPAEVLMYFGPIISQSGLYKSIGTEFIEVPLTNKILGYIKKASGDFSELELFISTFLYADMQGNDYPRLIENAVEKMNNKFVLELSYLKIMSYYSIKSKNSSLLPVFEKIMANIMVKVKGMSKIAAKKLIEYSLKDYKKEMSGITLQID